MPDSDRISSRVVNLAGKFSLIQRKSSGAQTPNTTVSRTTSLLNNMGKFTRHIALFAFWNGEDAGKAVGNT